MGFLDASHQTNKQLGLTVMTVSAMMVFISLYFAPADVAPISEFLAFFVLGTGLVALNAYYCYEALRRYF